LKTFGKEEVRNLKKKLINISGPDHRAIN